MRLRAVALASALAAALIVSSAAAQTAPVVVAPSAPAVVALVTPRCERAGLDEEAFARLLRIELLADGVTSVQRAEAPPRGPEPGLAVISIEGGCAGDATVTVIIDDAATDKSVRRTLALGDVPVVARPRTLALAAAELLRASWAELVLPDAPRPRTEVPPAVRASTVTRLAQATAPEPPPSPPEPRPAPPLASLAGRDPARSWFLEAGLDGRIFFRGHASVLGVLGARGGASLPLHGPLRLRVAVGGWAGSAADALGQIDLALVTGSAGLGFAVGVWRDVRIELGPDLEVGWAHATGQAVAATTAVIGGGTWSAIGSVFATGRLRLSGRFWVSADVRFGAVFKGLTATADARDVAGLSGATGGARVGVAIEL